MSFSPEPVKLKKKQRKKAVTASRADHPPPWNITEIHSDALGRLAGDTFSLSQPQIPPKKTYLKATLTLNVNPGSMARPDSVQINVDCGGTPRTLYVELT